MTTRRVLLLRKECFGGTIFDIASGRRAYVNKVEFESIERESGLSEHLIAELGMNDATRIVSPAWIPDFNFSAPDTVFFEVTRACNLRCTHCLNRSGIRSTDELTQAQRLFLVEDLALAGVQEIRFTGGEPLMLHEIGDLLAYASSFDLRISLGTNAVLATDKKVREIAGSLHHAVVSIEGMEQRHDAIRGRGTFRKAMMGMENFLSRGITVRVNTVLMRSGISDTIQLAKHLFSRGIPLYIRRLIPSGRAADMRSEMLRADEYSEVCAQIQPYLNDPRGLTQGHHLNDKATQTRITLPFRRNSCSAGQRGLVVLPNGSLQTCGFLGSLGEKPVGKMPDESLTTVWKRLVASKHIASLEANLAVYNSRGSSAPRTNCLAIAFASHACTSGGES